MDSSKERKVLSHEPKPGYPTAFYVVLIIGVLYLIFVFALHH